jgi:hypothetical protein
VLLNAVPIELNYPIPISREVPIVSGSDVIRRTKETLSILRVSGYPYNSREERMARQEASAKRIKQLETDAGAWHRARDLRRYIRAAHRRIGTRKNEARYLNETLDYLAWAERYVDQLDPLYEPATVVVGSIVHSDEQLEPAIAAIERVLDTVPKRYRDGFVFHATAIWNSQTFRPDWGREKRKAFLMAVMAVPRACGIAVSYGVFNRDG